MLSNINVPAPANKSANDKPAVERLTYTARETSASLGVSTVTLWRLEKRGVLLPIPGLRHKLYSVAALRRFAEQGAAA